MQFAWQLFDSSVTQYLRPEYRSKHVTKVVANSIEELVEKLEDVNKPELLKTIREFNAAVKRDVPFSPNVKDGRCTVGLELPKSNWAIPLENPPFEAYAVTCGITFTFGGLKINTHAQVVSSDGEPIPGLYAAGELVGGIFWFNYPGGSGLTNGAVFGRIAGENAGKNAYGTS
jgi:tricarballylate dehydrogenase